MNRFSRQINIDIIIIIILLLLIFFTFKHWSSDEVPPPEKKETINQQVKKTEGKPIRKPESKTVKTSGTPIILKKSTSNFVPTNNNLNAPPPDEYNDVNENAVNEPASDNRVTTPVFSDSQPTERIRSRTRGVNKGTTVPTTHPNLGMRGENNIEQTSNTVRNERGNTIVISISGKNRLLATEDSY